MRKASFLDTVRVLFAVLFIFTLLTVVRIVLS